MSIDVEPLELNFRRPFTVEVSQTLTIKNTSSSPLAFKVKTTAPKQYCVRPNAGRIEPGQDFDVSVLLQAMKTDPAPDAKCRDKFLVQSAPITGDREFTSIAEVLDNTDKALMQERKIRVNWLASGSEADPVPAAVTPNRKSAEGKNGTPEASRTFSSPSAGAPPPYSDDATVGASDEKTTTIGTPASGLAGRAGAAVASAGKETLEDVKAKLATAQAELASYKSGGGGGLRQRTTAKNDGEKGPVAAELAQAVKQPADGVAVKIVAILCMLSFLLGYFFF